MKIEKYIEENFKLENLVSQNSENLEDIKNFYPHAKSDAICCYKKISNYIKKNSKILEVGGGIHLLTNYLNQKYDITSIEPGGFTVYEEEIRNQILKKSNLNIHTVALEHFETTEKYDFIFSMNVLEHTKDINLHIKSCIKLLKNENSVLFIQCLNYLFPFDTHFYEFFIPFAPKFTFQRLKKNKLVKKLGKEKYNNILKNLNFDCNYNFIKKIDSSINFKNPIKEIFNRISEDEQYRKKISKNYFLKITYKVIMLLKIKKVLFKIFPKSIFPYLIFSIKKNSSDHTKILDTVPRISTIQIERQ